MVSSVQERQVDSAAGAMAAEVVAETAAHGEDCTHFSEEGELPAVGESDPSPPQPSASDRAYGRGGAGRASATRALGAAARAAGAGAVAGAVTTATTTHMLHGVRIVTPPGVSVAATSEAGAIITQLVGRNEVAQQKLTEARATIVIIPSAQKMTDLAQFSGLRGRTTFDGRAWENVRGSGGMRAPDGSLAIGVAEENLATIPGVLSSYPAGYSIGMHELAHTLEMSGMTKGQKERLKALYAQQKRHDAADFTDSYAASNEHEYFAQATNAFFGKNVGRGTDGKANANGRAWLQQRDPDMYEFLVQMYETDYRVDEPRS